MMFRRIRKILSILSLLLAFSFTLLWIRSYWYLDEIRCNYQKLAPKNHHLIIDCNLTSTTGTLLIEFANIDIDLERPDPVHGIYGPDSAELGLYSEMKTSHFPLSSNEAEIYSDVLSRGVAGFAFKHESSFFFAEPHLARWTWITMPHWFLTFLFSVPALFHIGTRIRRRSSLRRGLCPTCGYDLRESQSTCPECGAVNTIGSR